jgi:hypothetical protein
MKRGPKQSFPGDNHAPAEGVDAIVQIKVWLLGISPMVWRRVLVPVRLTLRELHGIIQVAMGWESIHLYQFRLRAGAVRLVGAGGGLARRHAGGAAVPQGRTICLRI